MLKLEGKTTEGRSVVSGVYSFYETHGIPIITILEILDSRGITPDWISFYQEANKAGVKGDRIISMLSNDIADVYGGSFRDTVIQRLGHYRLTLKE
jgi:alanyl-tRNA synthetase